MRKWLICILVACAACALAQHNWSTVVETAKAYEIQTMVEPDWAKRTDTPLFHAAWLSDMHIGQKNTKDIPSAQDLTTEALRVINNNIRPDFVMITGDNCGFYPKDSKVRKPVAHLRQLWFHTYLQQNLDIPYHVVPGDNWPVDFEKVFGSTHYSLDYHGFHFQFNATDVISPSDNGCSTFKPDTLEWMKRDLDANADRPCIYILHEPVWPPSFLDAGKVNGILGRRPQVVAALGGHLHLDLEFEHGSYKSILAPSVGKSHRPGFKHLRFWRDLVVLETYEWDGGTKTFLKVSKWQKIDIPENLRNPPPATKEQVSKLPPTPKTIDEALGKRYQEVTNNFVGFILSFGLQQITSPKAP